MNAFPFLDRPRTVQPVICVHNVNSRTLLCSRGETSESCLPRSRRLLSPWRFRGRLGPTSMPFPSWWCRRSWGAGTGVAVRGLSAVFCFWVFFQHWVRELLADPSLTSCNMWKTKNVINKRYCMFSPVQNCTELDAAWYSTPTKIQMVTSHCRCRLTIQLQLARVKL